MCGAHSNFQLDIKSWQQGVSCKSDRLRIINLHTVAFILNQGNTNISFSDNNMAPLPSLALDIPVERPKKIYFKVWSTINCDQA